MINLISDDGSRERTAGGCSSEQEGWLVAGVAGGRLAGCLASVVMAAGEEAGRVRRSVDSQLLPAEVGQSTVVSFYRTTLPPLL